MLSAFREASAEGAAVQAPGAVRTLSDGCR